MSVRRTRAGAGAPRSDGHARAHARLVEARRRLAGRALVEVHGRLGPRRLGRRRGAPLALGELDLGRGGVEHGPSWGVVESPAASTVRGPPQPSIVRPYKPLQ